MENNQNQAGDNTATNQAGNTAGTNQGAIPFKAFTSEEEYNKELQSIQSKAKGEVLKELGVNSLAEVKQNQTKYAEFLKTQKTAEELQNEELNTLKNQNQKLVNELRGTTVKSNLDTVLKEYEIEDDYKTQAKDTIYDLLNKDDLFDNDKLKADELKVRVGKLIDDRLPMFKKKTTKAGTEIPPAKTTLATSDYLKEKYKNNPYFKG